MSSSADDPGQKELLQLLEKRNADPSNSDLETHFYNSVLQYLLKTSLHWWCSDAVFPIAKESLWLFSLPDHEHIHQYKSRLNAKLGACVLCAEKYHEAKRLLRQRYNTIFAQDNVDKFFSILDAFDHDRIQVELGSVTRVPFTLTDTIRAAVCELLFAPHLLNNELDELFSRLFDEIQKTGIFPTFESSAAQGVMILTFHHHRVVCFWARKLLEKYSREGYKADKSCLPTLCTLIHPVIPQKIAPVEYPITMTKDTGDMWKALRLVVSVLDTDTLNTLMSSASKDMPDVLREQLALPDIGYLSDVLRVMADMLIKMKDRFWGVKVINSDSGPFADFVKSICEHRGFKEAMKIAQDGNVGKILQRDGSAYPEDKLVAKMKVNVDWIYPLWESLRNTPVQQEMTGKVLDILLGYFQLAGWAILFKACSAELGFQIMQRQLSDNQPPNNKINEYAQRLVDFATIDPARLPSFFEGLPMMANAILLDVLARDTRSLHDTLLIFSLSTNNVIEFTNGSMYEAVWNAVEKVYKQAKTTRQQPIPLARAVFQSYVPIAGIDIPWVQLDSGSTEAKLLSRIRDRRLVVKEALESIADLPWEVVKNLTLEPVMLDSFLSLACSPFPELQSACSKLIRKDTTAKQYEDAVQYFFDKEPHKALVTLTNLLGSFNELCRTAVDVFNLVPTVSSILRHIVELLTGDEESYLLLIVMSDFQANKIERKQLQTFWEVGWKTMSLIFGQGLKWAENHKPKQVVDLIIPVLEIALQLTGSQPSFDKIAQNIPSKESELSYVHMNESMDHLSHWIYVTRSEVLQRLTPLTNIILRQLQEAHIKISLDAYDRLMTAATGVNTSRLSDDDKEQLFLALSAHEPANTIFIDDSDDDDLEWQTVGISAHEDGASRTSLSSSSKTNEPASATRLKREKAPKITSYFGSAQPGTKDMPMDLDEDIDDLCDIDFSELPDEWFEGKTSNQSIDLVGKAEGRNSEETQTTHVNRQLALRAPGARQHQQPVRTGGPRVFPPSNSQPYAVTSTGRKLKPPSMGFSKLKSLRAEFRAERQLNAAAKYSSSKSLARRRRDDDKSTSGSDSSDDDEDGNGTSGLLDLVQDIDDSKASIEAKRALFEQKPRRSIKLIESPATKYFAQRRKQMQAMATRRKKITPDINRLYKTICTWDVTSTSEMPPNATKELYSNVKNNYESFEEYRKIFEPLLLLEVWMQLVRSKEALSETDVIDRCLLDSRCHVDSFVDLTFSMPSNMAVSLAVDDLVCVANHFGQSFFRTEAADELGRSWKGRLFLGRITAISQRKNASNVTTRSHFSSDRITLLNMLAPKTTWCMLRLMSLTTVQREFSALEGLGYYDLGQEIICPTPHSLPPPTEREITNCIQSYSVNRPQAEAIVGAVAKKKGFTLIQGPPGTGKTKTILGLIAALLKEREAQTNHANNNVQRAGGKLLVCAPSNAAIDEIAKRLKEGIPSGGRRLKPNVVRIGVADSVNASVKDLILDRLIEKELMPTEDDPVTNKTWAIRRENIKEEMRKIQLDIEEVEREISSSNDTVNLTALQGRRKHLFQERSRRNIMMKNVNDEQRDYTREMDVSRLQARQKIFANADVVCATLSGSGHDMLTSLGLTFETVVVDEAAQAIEISSLIPLKYDCQRCVLVGDPNQLPPTVLSLMAAKYSYEQSLFMRLQNNTPDDVFLLSIQYRMHPEISVLPSKLFYDAQLRDGPDMATASSAVWHSDPDFPPYCFFNVQEGQEQTGRGKSLYNTAEADAAVALIDKLASRLPKVKFAYKIGVITPYKQQLSQLKSRFERRFGARILNVIDFNTVDGFQGQEKDIILFSCVRAGSGSGIGFLSDTRRMNVGLTRAKRSLFVLGHAPTLKKSSFWGDLVRNAKQRDLLVNCQQPYFDHQLAPKFTAHNLFDIEALATVKRPLPLQERMKDITLDETKAPVVKRKRDPILPDIKESRRRVDDDRQATLRDPAREEAGTTIMTTVGGEDKLMEKEGNNCGMTSERREGDMKGHPFNKQTLPRKQLQPPRKPTLAEYQAPQGLPSLPATASTSPPVVRKSRPGPSSLSNRINLFIPKGTKPNKRPPSNNTSSDGLGARERAILEHKAAKETMRRIREDEAKQREARQGGQNDREPRNPKEVDLDELIRDVSRRDNRNSSSSL